ncbi:NAD(P)-dependent oxidoreductase [Pseudoalteromonas citrea]|uniref:NAD(P)-dependent oxidoreductase n=1 Tax=Pseudoalteromonas citrea TaxID=43655 RepID=A0A5S3XL93_9GAMM|nr:SDR family oxidoreductase [Pseudoalteromonas citrea]TMP38319.1 NAD(P)-dependent oxidoreductase [Pseudoalteromonas citrea]TMP54753.1 NAD(P)-dependent oxidoreductase [Pseudoalteromonas citrea]
MVISKKVVLITGGGRGIGAATASLLAKENYIVAINYKEDEVSVKKLLSSIRLKGGCAEAFKADISDESQVEELFSSVIFKYGPITHLVNNVGVLARQQRVENMTSDRINYILQHNVTPYFICAREAVKHFKRHDDMSNCAIVNVSSAASRLGGANEYVDYAASKGAIDTFTIGLSLELAEYGVRVNCVRPGCIYTDIHRDGGEAERVSRLAPQLPLRRGGTALEVANAIAWLLSDEASYVTGSFIDLAGGK